MIFLLLSILSSSLIYMIFKWIGKKDLSNFKVIVINYATAGLVGFLREYDTLATITPVDLVQAPWFMAALSLGIFFIFVFNLMALTTQRNGTSTAVIATKMSLVIPVIVAFFLYHDDISFLKISGIVLALVGVYLSVNKGNSHHAKASFLLPVLVFFCSGIIDVSLKYVQEFQLYDHTATFFVPTIFLFAFLTGMLKWAYDAFTKKMSLNLRTLLAGSTLGLINFYSIEFLIKALEVKGIQSSVVFSLNNISIVMLSVLLSVLIFKERIQTSNKIGLILSILAIVLITLSQ